jgi:pimeloyl-ACP methyl ester carboxylesterase
MIDQRHFVARDGTRIGYQVSGQGPCIVLANGLGGTYIAFRHLYDALDGYRVVCWDYPGLYTSSPPTDPAANTVPHQVGDLMEILDREQVDGAVIVGWSMGVQVAFEALKRVGLVSETIDLEIFRAVAAAFQHVDWRIYTDLRSRLDEHDADALLPAIAVPVAIVTGDRDLITPPATAERIHRTIRGSRLVVIEGGTHYTPVEYPAIVVDELGRLLDRVPGWQQRALEGAV